MTEKTPAEIEIEKLEKGCGKEFVYYNNFNGNRIGVFNCGNIIRNLDNEEVILCDKCKEKLSGFKQCLELGRKELASLQEKIEELDNQFKHTLNDESLLNIEKRIISKFYDKFKKIFKEMGQ